MLASGNSYGRGLHLAMSGEELLDRAKRARAVFLGDRISASHVGINHSHHADFLPLLLELVVHTGVVTSECSYADDGNVDHDVRCELLASQPVGCPSSGTFDQIWALSSYNPASCSIESAFFKMAT